MVTPLTVTDDPETVVETDPDPEEDEPEAPLEIVTEPTLALRMTVTESVLPAESVTMIWMGKDLWTAERPT